MPQPQTLRILSIDMLRALTMVLMIFVNDLWSLKDIPGWLEHTQANEDGMGLADTVFPAFLFIVGMSIPFSVYNRRTKGENNASIAWHVLTRAIALLVMGLFLVNGEYINEAATGMKRVVWNSFCCISFILIWNAYSKTVNRWFILSAKVIGIATLIALVFVYRGGKEAHGFQTYWWGILGLIGWAYLVTALIYTFSGKSFTIPVAAWLFFIALCAASHAGWIEHRFIKTIIGPFGDGAMPAFTMGGVIVSLVYQHFAKQQRHTRMMLVLLALAIVLFAAGVYLRQFWGISKIRATPAWVLICSAITIVAFIFLYWLADLKHKTTWFNLVKPAGTNTLLCYLLPYFAYAMVVLLHLSLPEILLSGGIGLLKSFLFAMLMVAIAGLLGRWGLRLKL